MSGFCAAQFNDVFCKNDKCEALDESHDKMCSLKTCEEFINVFREKNRQEVALVFAIENFEDLTVSLRSFINR